MDTKEASELLGVSELSPQNAIDSAFKQKVEAIGREVRATTDSARLAYLKGELRKCVEAKKLLLPNAPVMSKPGNKAPPKTTPDYGLVRGDTDEGEQRRPSDKAQKKKQSRRLKGQGRDFVEKEGRSSDVEDGMNEPPADSPEKSSSGSSSDMLGNEGADFQDTVGSEVDSEVDSDPVKGDEDSIEESEAQGSASAPSGIDASAVEQHARFHVPPKLPIVVAVVFILGVLLFFVAQVTNQSNRYNESAAPDASEVLLKAELEGLIDKVNERITQVNQYKDSAVKKLAEGTKILGESGVVSNEVYQEMIRIVSTKLMTDSVEFSRQERIRRGREALAADEFYLAMSLIRGVIQEYEGVLERLESIEEAALARIKARQAQQVLQSWVSKVALRQLPIGRNLEIGLLQAENAYLELELVNAIQLFSSVKNQYVQTLSDAKKLLKMQEQLESFSLKWDLMSWSSDVEKTLVAREINQHSRLLEKALQAGNVKVAIEISEPLLLKYPKAIKARERVNDSRREAQNARQKYSKKVGDSDQPEASESYKKGIVALRGGDWDRAWLQFNKARDQYLGKAGFVVQSSSDDEKQLNYAEPITPFHKEATRIVPVMIRVRGGTFQMGDISRIGDSTERPVHEVTVPTFSMSKFEITFAQYDQFALATNRAKPNDEGWGRGARPVINVTWYDAVEYTKWLSEFTGDIYRLPTEAEWEYAVRAGTQTIYYWGNLKKPQAATCGSCGNAWDAKTTSPVGVFQPNPLGIYDMLGNVSEWVLDCWNGDYTGVPVDGSAKKLPNCKRSIVRGGSWEDDWWLLRISARYPSERNLLVGLRGFRVVKEHRER